MRTKFRNHKQSIVTETSQEPTGAWETTDAVEQPTLLDAVQEIGAFVDEATEPAEFAPAHGFINRGENPESTAYELTLPCPACEWDSQLTCTHCIGRGRVVINEAAIRAAITGRAGSLRSIKPVIDAYGSAYVWRIVRFNLGIDASVPYGCFREVGCGDFIGGLQMQILRSLDAIAKRVTNELVGQLPVPAARWNVAVGRGE